MKQNVLLNHVKVPSRCIPFFANVASYAHCETVITTGTTCQWKRQRILL